MKKLTKLITAVLMAAFCLSSPHAAASVQAHHSYSAQTFYVDYCSESITLRSSPDVFASEICQIPFGAAVSFLETSVNGFYKVQYAGHTGYALASYLEPQTGSYAPYETYFVSNCRESITLRPAPDVSSGEICQIPLGSPVSFLSSARNGFYEIYYHGNHGYALASYLSDVQEVIPSVEPFYFYTTYYVVNCRQSITLRSAPNVSSGEICQIPLGAAVSFVETAANDFYKIIYNGTAGYALASYLSESPQSYSYYGTPHYDYYAEPYYNYYADPYYVTNCKQSITLRTHPNASANEICQIPLGALVDFYSTAANEFYYIGYNGFTGYALAAYLKPATGQYLPSDTCIVVNCNESITLRTHPSTSANEICQIPLGSAVTFCSDVGNGFYEICYNGTYGYSLASYLTFQ